MRQQGNPYIVRAGEVQQLQPAQNAFDEAWLQGFLLAHPEAIPVGEIEPAFAPLIPVCRELPTAAGPVDMLFANDAGLLTLVECKLWKNPEARRQVVGQILDYAKELSRWSYQDLQAAIRTARGTTEPSLYQLAAANSEDLDERDFGVFTIKDEFYNCGIAATTADRGRPDIGEAYLTELAALFPQGRVERGPSRFWWTVKGSPGNRYLRTLELLAVEDRWLQVVRATLDRLAESDGG